MTRDEALSVLGLPPDATREDITVAYRELAQMMHPDKYGDNKRLRDRAEQQMRSINQARDVLLKGAGAARSASTRSASSRSTSAATETRSSSARAGATRDSRPRYSAASAAARAQAAETARLTVVAQLRTLREQRRRAMTMTAGGLLGMLICSRFRGMLRTLGFPICSTFAVWGIVDLVSTTGQINVLKVRARELMQERDAARAAAGEKTS